MARRSKDDSGIHAPGPKANPASTQKMNEIKGKIDEAQGIMRKNLEDEMERGERLEGIESKSAKLESSSKAFKAKTKAVEKKLWYKNMRMWVYLILALVILVVLIVLLIFLRKQLGL